MPEIEVDFTAAITDDVLMYQTLENLGFSDSEILKMPDAEKIFAAHVQGDSPDELGFEYRRLPGQRLDETWPEPGSVQISFKASFESAEKLLQVLKDDPNVGMGEEDLKSLTLERLVMEASLYEPEEIVYIETPGQEPITL
jgi:hypothetical protein